MSNVAIAFIFSAIAGLSTGIGSAMAFFAKKTNTRFLSVSLGFSAGVMIYASMVEMFPKAVDSLSLAFGDKMGLGATILAFFGGMLLIVLIDKLLPENNNPHEVRRVEESAGEQSEESKNNNLLRMGIFTALAITIHNFPEGLATFVSTIKDPTMAIPIVVAIAIHNIPEGIVVSIPVYYATGSKKKAFLLSFASGLTEPLGAVIGYLVLMPFMSDMVYGILFAMVSGIMVFISLDELLPSAREYGEQHLAIYGLVAGMAVMASSLFLLA